MSADQTIPRLAERPEPTRFDALRADGIARLEAMAGGVWTDYNLHDPGVTLLEALCYSLTELAYRADFEVRDLLAGPRPGAHFGTHEGKDADDALAIDRPESLWGAPPDVDPHDHIDWAALALHLPAQVFPCRPTTLDDLQQWLLDQLPQLDGATVRASATTAGLYDVVLDEAADHQVPNTPQLARELLASQRNLGEDLGRLLQVRKTRCRLHGLVVIAGARDATDIAAEVFEVCAALLSDTPLFNAAAEELPAGQSLDRLLCGPLLQRGRLRPEADAPDQHRYVFIADMMDRVGRIDGVAEVQWLGVEAVAQAGEPPGTVSTQALERRSADGLQGLWLAPPANDTELRSLMLQRRGNVIALPAHEVQRRFDERRAAQRARRHGLRDLDLAFPPPRGLQPQAWPHLSVQHLLPGNYGVGANGVPESAREQDKLQALQLQAYLLMFDQPLANGRAQLQHLRELFGVAPPSPSSSSGPITHWWAAQGRAQVPGIDAVTDGTPAAVLRSEVQQPFDKAIERRHRVLDRLLALHGQTFTQNSLRQYSGHLLPDELDAYLLRNKTAFVSDLLRLGQDRAAGIDLTRRCWRNADNCSGLQRQVSLLLGFEQIGSRRLSAGLRGLHWRDDAEPAANGYSARPAGLQRLDLADAALSASSPAEDAAGWQGALDAWWLQVGAAADRYAILPAQHGQSARLVLGPDDAGRYRSIAFRQSLDAAQITASVARWRQRLLRINAACEGLHVVEHVLLRRLAPADEGEVLAEDSTPALAVSVIFPDWTHRCSQPNFQRLAEESVRMACPVQLRPQCLWLGPAAMRRFETLYLAWLRRRRHLGAAEPTRDRAAKVDAASAPLLAQLLKWADSQAARRARLEAAARAPGAGA